MRSEINERSEDFTYKEETSSTRGHHGLIFRNRLVGSERGGQR